MRKAWTRPPPVEEEWKAIEPTVSELYQQLKEATANNTSTSTSASSQWPIFRLHHQRSRYLFDLYYQSRTISKATLDWCVEQGVGDGELMAKWRRPGYEGLCCLRCIQRADSTHGTVCICRVPQEQRALQDGRQVIECQLCGCRGCCSGGNNNKN